jgi:predicted short-subunit dehydrogenase-like oxidoreductase (DUF2520 family)
VGVEVEGLLGRADDIFESADGVDALLLTVADGELASVAAAIRPVASTVVIHCSGALGFEVLKPHERVGLIHPLVTIPDPVIGAQRLCSGGYFAVAGDQVAADLVAALGGRALSISQEARATYHAAACIASNHLVALLAQVERVGASIGLPLEVFMPLARAALDDVESLGVAAAITGPVARGDLATIERHRQVLGVQELGGYDAGVALVRQLLATAHSDPGVGAGALSRTRSQAPLSDGASSTDTLAGPCK